MAIKIIKDGTKEFRMTCLFCGCEFTYENEDICNSVVICPWCLKSLLHKEVIGTVNDKPFIGKFKSVDALYRAYERLEAEFTRRSQRLKELEAGAQRNKIEIYPSVSPDSCDGGKSDNWSYCEGCPNNPKYLKTPYIGDSPCQWCQKNPYKVTCTSDIKQGE